ncbi:hypothetical protein TELCIR_16280, partial [Teladorsagia circumcincta]
MRLAIMLAAVYTTTSLPAWNDYSKFIGDRGDKGGYSRNLHNNSGAGQERKFRVIRRRGGSEKWECGMDPLTKYLSRRRIERKCPQVQNGINGCCKKHDKCYLNQKGRKFCDDEFCGCLNVKKVAHWKRPKRDGLNHDPAVRAMQKVSLIGNYTPYNCYEKEVEKLKNKQHSQSQ